MQPDDLKPIYLTDGERAVIAYELLDNAETQELLGNEARSKHLYFLAGLIAYGPGPKVRAS